MAFRTSFGHFQLKVLNFGLTNALATFESAMNNVFKDVMGKLVLVYLDNILIFLKNLEEHRMHVRHVLETLRKQCFCAKASKCTFCFSELEYLGHMVGMEQNQGEPKNGFRMWWIGIRLRQLRYGLEARHEVLIVDLFDQL